MARLFLILFVWVAGVFMPACGGPCEKLASYVCDCMKTASARQNCKTEMDIRGRYDGFKKAVDDQVCENAMRTCDCNAVRDLRIEQCGMTR